MLPPRRMTASVRAHGSSLGNPRPRLAERLPRRPLRVLVPALRCNQRSDALAFPVPVGRLSVAQGEAIDIGERFVVPDLNNPAEHGDCVIPVLDVEHGDGDPRIAAHVAKSQPLKVHVDEQVAVIPVVPRRRGVWSPVRADRGDYGSVWLLEEFDEFGRKRCPWHGTSLGLVCVPVSSLHLFSATIGLWPSWLRRVSARNLPASLSSRRFRSRSAAVIVLPCSVQTVP